MSLSDYQQTHSWQGAIELGPHIVKVAEQLPGTEQTGLSQHLRVLMVELAGAVAIDLLNGSKTRLPVALRLAAAMELVERVYPALDTSDARTALYKLTDRLNSDKFDEQVTTPNPLPLAPGITADLPNEGEEASTTSTEFPPVAAPVPMPPPAAALAPAQSPPQSPSNTAPPESIPVIAGESAPSSAPQAAAPSTPQPATASYQPTSNPQEPRTIHVQPDRGQ